MSEYLQSRGRTLLGTKIILCGLAEAGKTSIRDVVFGGKDPSEVEGYGATLNYVRQIVDLDGAKKATLMDLGGQKIFLERFVSKFSPFVFHNVAALIFVIDIANSERFGSAKHYFDAALGRLNKYSPKAAFFVLLHKMDLMQGNPGKDEILEHIQSLIQTNHDKQIPFYETTIYNESIKIAVKDILKRAFPDVYSTSASAPAATPSVVAPRKMVSDTPPSSIKAPQTAVITQQITAQAPPSQKPSQLGSISAEIDLSAVVRALKFIESPTAISYSEPEITDTIPTHLDPEMGEEIAEEYAPIVKALRFAETGIIKEEEISQPQSQIEPEDEPELPTEPISDSIEDTHPSEKAIQELLSVGELELTPFTEAIESQEPPDLVTLPTTEFDTHPALSEEFDVFLAAEEIVRFLEAIMHLFKLSFVTVKMNDGENLVYVGDLPRYEELTDAVFDSFKIKTETDQLPLASSHITADNLFILIEPIGKSQTIIIIGPSTAKTSFHRIKREFTEQVTKMVNITFFDMF